MAGIRVPFHWRLFLLLVAFSLVMVGCFLGFQYMREKQYRAEKINEMLQIYNVQIADAMELGVTPEEFVSRHKAPLPGLRITLIKRDGQVVYDSESSPRDNHLRRPEVEQALISGTGFDQRRLSETTENTYFYSALATDNMIVRTAAPYSVTLSELLRADRGFLWFMLAVTLVMCVVAYFFTRRLGVAIERLNKFAARAERGEKVYGEASFPDNELGEISRHIVKLYASQQQAMEMKHRLTNNINHELKTPLAAMQVCLETLMAHPDLDREKRTQFVERCYANSQRLQNLLADVSTITRLEHGERQIATEAVSLAEVIKAVADEHQGQGLPISVVCEGQGIMQGNRPLLESVLQNLISNANNYSNGTGIEIRLSEGPESVSVSVSDDGVGIPEEHLPHIFERFYRVDKGRSRVNGGTGLGLAIVKNAVLFHKGSIKAENRIPHGLTIAMTFNKLQEK